MKLLTKLREVILSRGRTETLYPSKDAIPPEYPTKKRGRK